MQETRRQKKIVVDKFCNLLKQQTYRKIGDVEIESWQTSEPVFFNERMTGVYRKLEPEQQWGKLWDCAWMHVTGKVPETGIGSKVVLMIDISGEGCVFDANGNPLRGITTYASEFDATLGIPVKRVIDITERSQGNENIDFWIDAGCNDLFGRFVDSGKLKQAEICICEEYVRELYYDYKFLMMLCDTLDSNSSRRNQIESTLYDVAVNTSRNLSVNQIAEIKTQLSKHLAMKNDDQSLMFSAVGHAHIDLAWLWPIRETKRKAVRTFSTVLHMMNKYPDYVFGASQPQMYQWVKESQPELYKKIRERVQEGRWECQGTMWVEPDTNLSGGESLVRQILYGKRFFREEFGKDMRILWLPDVFGYSAALPQLLKKADVPYFMTIKLSWNEHNTFPHNTFIWKGLDGSEVLAHMPPENTYNSGAMPGSLRTAENNFKDKEVSNEALLLFGIGDGGGGPSNDHLEYLTREKSIAGLPSVKQEPAIRFFDRINEGRERYPKWQGELYLERHQGTYTTQANNKKYNRLIELALRDCEMLCTAANIYAEMDYPKEELETIWKEVLLYQFHDILPGSSIKRVYDESVERYHVLLDRVHVITDEASSCLADALQIGKNQKLVFNTLPWERTDTVMTDGGQVEISVPAYGYTVLNCDQVSKKSSDVTVEASRILENSRLRVEFNKNGTIASLYDKQAGREVLNQKAAYNNLMIYEDNGDCWDIPFTYREMKPQMAEVTDMGVITDATGSKLRFTYTYNDSQFIQTVSLRESSATLKFDMEVEWKETFKMLRACYPIDVVTSEASCNIQFGYIRRPTHRNTSWDNAKVEICAHKWVDLSEANYGVAIINNCKYGYNVWDNVLDINLLRSQMYPGVDADKGHHEFSYELFIHDGDLQKVNEEAYKFNTSLLTASGQSNSTAKAQGSLLFIKDENVLAEAVKLAEDGSGYILRLYESNGEHTNTTIRIPGVKSAQLTNLIEEPLTSLDLEDGSFRLLFKPFEVHTVLVRF